MVWETERKCGKYNENKKFKLLLSWYTFKDISQEILREKKPQI